MSLKAAAEKLKIKSDKDYCYFNTYMRQHFLSYESDAGQKSEVSIRDCPVKCLLLDNLVRLRYHSDPKPGEHRSQQMCTLPITIKGIPPDEALLATWHHADCEREGKCMCMADIVFTSESKSLPITLLAEEQDALQRFEALCTWGITSIWKLLTGKFFQKRIPFLK